MAPKKSKKKRTKMNVNAPVASGTLRGEQVSSAIDATKNTALLEDVLKANGEEHLYDTIKQLSVHVEDNPPVIFGWQNVEVFVEAIRDAQEQANAPGVAPLPPDPLGLPAALTLQNFKEAVLDYARIQEAPPRLDTTCLPCSLMQSHHVVCMLRSLDFNPWIQRIIAVGGPNALPIAYVYLPRPRSITLDRAMPPLQNSLWG
ncbi:hypothetical protein H310_08450 [Aphanomyces invadans]|uniref:Uncharacterized protein n=1 Tax=Aphanomyces invadans TaxID=157072 RepID=A0A024TYC5_9STRA|nr:hypothetical protein H310_08450 [Aphanomyces invadans]ETV98974.1 hypothetical protein H310_08450 [Aphanomyces invadans]|eukprot:XP_008872402.1 hypothetical protein H310_08450 [Aphanomyces invadans]